MNGSGGIQIIGIVLGAVAGAWVYSDAKKRGMNAIGWGIGSFLVCIVFLPLYLIIRKPLLAQVPPGYPPPGTPGYLPPGTPGYPVYTQPPPPPPQFQPAGTLGMAPPPPAAPSAGPVHFCVQCGQKYEGNVKFCPICGAPQ